MKQSNLNKPTERRQIIQALPNFYFEKSHLLNVNYVNVINWFQVKLSYVLRDVRIEHLNSKITDLKNEIKLKKELNRFWANLELY